MVISIWIIIGSVLELEIGGYISLAIYFLIGYGLHLLMTVLRKNTLKKYQMLGTLTPEDSEKFGAIDSERYGSRPFYGAFVFTFELIARNYSPVVLTPSH